MKLRAFVALGMALILLSGPIEVTPQNQEKTFCVLHDFGPPKTKDAIWPSGPAGFVLADDGNIWTAINRGGASDAGAVIKITPAGKYTKVADFDQSSGIHPEGGLVNGNNGYLFGTTSEGGRWDAGTIYRISVQSGRLEVIYDFRNGRTTGIKPQGKCTTPQHCEYSPAQRANMSGGYPVSAPVVVGENLYGVTSHSDNQRYGTLYSIPLNSRRSNSSTASTTANGDDEPMKVRCIFQPSLQKDPEMKQFRCNTNGTFAHLLIAGRDGSLYGTTYSTDTGLNGTVFRTVAGGGPLISLHEFDSKNGRVPVALMEGSDGNLYGTAMSGGGGGADVVFKLNPTTHEFDVLTNFPNPVDNEYVRGGTPLSGVVEGKDGNLFGTLEYGGLYNGGILYRVSKAPKEKGDYDFRVLRDFENLSSGRNPVALATFGDGYIYGTAFQEGQFGGGSFFRYRTDRVAIGGGRIIFHDSNNVFEVHAGAMATQERDPKVPDQDKDLNHGIAVRLRCDNDPHFIQFIYREVIKLGNAAVPPGDESHPNGELLKKLPDPKARPLLFNTRCSRCPKYSVTASLNDLHWAPDAPDVPDTANGVIQVGSPFFEKGRSAEFDCDALTLFDRPEIRPDAVEEVFYGPNIVVRTVARDYAICGGQVVWQVTWISDETVGQDSSPHWKYQAIARPVSNNKIPDSFLCLLKTNGYPLPAGQSIGSGVDCNHLPPMKVEIQR